MAKNSPSLADDRLYTEREAARFLNLSHRTLQDWRVTGRGPAFIRLESAVRYRAADLLAFVNARVCPQNGEAR